MERVVVVVGGWWVSVCVRGTKPRFLIIDVQDFYDELPSILDKRHKIWTHNITHQMRTSGHLGEGSPMGPVE